MMDLCLTNTQLLNSRILFGLLFWWHPFTAEVPLVSKWWNAKFLQICSDEETNSYFECPVSEHIFIFGWTIPFKIIPSVQQQWNITDIMLRLLNPVSQKATFKICLHEMEQMPLSFWL